MQNMENNHPFNDLLVKYLVSNLTEEETTLVEDWINQSEENRKHVDKLKQVWKLTAVSRTLEQVDVDHEWIHFKEAIAEKEVAAAAIPAQEQYGNEPAYEEMPGNRSSARRLLIRVAMAASVLLAIGLGWQALFNNKQPAIVAQEEQKAIEVAPVLLRHEINTTGSSKIFLLQDGSRIVLWDKSEVHFPEPFTGNKRDIILKGKADFKVAKDSTRPFTVYCGDIATTVLGTTFTVSAYDYASLMTVRLYEGKVLVKSYDSVQGRMKYEYVLKPGQEFVFDKKQSTAIVRRFNGGHSFKKEEEEEILYEPSADEPVTTGTKGSWFMFNNQSLAQVFEQLANMYEVKIIYSKKEVKNMYFIGKYNKSDSLEHILKQIAILNNLTVTKADNTFTISK
jgi:transmembrane sensor